MPKHAKQLFWNALLLSAASLIMRTVGVWFGVYVSNRAGAEAMGLFSLMAGVYGFALTLATSGIHLGVTRVITEAIGEGKRERIAPAMRHAVLYALCFGLGAAAGAEHGKAQAQAKQQSKQFSHGFSSFISMESGSAA